MWLGPGRMTWSVTRSRWFLQTAWMVTLSDTHSFRKNLTAMLESVEAHANATKQFNLNPGNVVTRVGDCRDLSASHIGNDSIDAIVTSPPYSVHEGGSVTQT